MKVTFMRHAESAYNKTKTFQGQRDIPLSQDGVAAARALGENYEYTDFDVCITSPLKRARKTADHVTCGMVKIVEDPRVSEIALGELEGTPVTEEALSRLSDLDYAPAGGESKRMLDVRVRSFLDSLKKEYKGKVVLVVTHAGVISSVKRVLGLPAGRTPNLGVIEIDI